MGIENPSFLVNLPASDVAVKRTIGELSRGLYALGNNGSIEIAHPKGELNPC